MKTPFSALAGATSAILFGMCSPFLNAEIPSQLSVDPGAVATVTLSITVSSDLGSETKVDSITVPVTGGGGVVLGPDQEPFTSVNLNSMQFFLGGGALQYEFFCSPTFGCIDVSVNLGNISATLAQPAGASIIGNGRADFFGPWNLNADYSIESILFTNAGVIDTTASVNFGTTWNAQEGQIFVNELGLGSIQSEVPGDGIPDNLQVTLLTEVNLGNSSLSGTYVPSPPAACGSGGYCGGAHADSGCDDIACCAAVCEIDFFCCEFSWDDSCMIKALETCGLIPENDNCATPRSLGLGRFVFSTINCNTDGPPLITECIEDENGGFLTNDVWFAHSPTQDNFVTVSTCGHADFDTWIVVYDECGGTVLACNNNTPICPGFTSQAQFLGVAGETYLIQVGGVNTSGSGEIDIAWTNPEPSYPNSLTAEWSVSSGGNGHSYGLFALGGLFDFDEVTETALRLGGYPATITSPEEQAFINQNMPATLLGGATAIGLVQSGDDEPSGGWEWITGEPFAWSNWFPGEPNDPGSAGEDWVNMYPNGQWNDSPNAFGHVLVEFEDPAPTDERVWLSEDGGNGHTYQAVILPERVSWNEARVYAENRGGTLVNLETSEEAEWLWKNMVGYVPLWSMTYYNSGPWIGLFRHDNEWQWLSGEEFDWDGWSPGEPNGTGDFAGYYGAPRFLSSFTEDFGPGAVGELFNTAVYADVFGNNRLKLVSDGQSGTFGTWISPSIEDTIVSMDVTFKFSFKNEAGGPGDGFAFVWGDLSDTSGIRAEGGEEVRGRGGRPQVRSVEFRRIGFQNGNLCVGVPFGACAYCEFSEISQIGLTDPQLWPSSRRGRAYLALRTDPPRPLRPPRGPRRARACRAAATPCRTSAADTTRPRLLL